LYTENREQAINTFLARAGWGKAPRTPLAADASTRRYARLHGPKGRAILMDSPPATDEHLCPPGASAKQRQSLGYFALARLAGSSTHAFAALADALVMRGFSAPTILAADHEHGLLLLEDLGDALFSNAVTDKITLYSAATDTLAALCRSSFDAQMPPGKQDWTVQTYDEHALLCEADLLLDWYAPYAGTVPDDGARKALQNLWRDAFLTLENLPKVLVLRDVHAENLLWLPKREGHARTGLLDFQDALFGSPAYDLVSLLQDSRRTLPDGLEQAMLKRFLEHAKINDPEAFMTHYAVLGAQRSAKVLGIFVRLAIRDNKPRYLEYLPITARNLVRSLQHPHLDGLQQWMKAHLPGIFEEGTP
jgi:N-acetylmuramate 1-kinase